MNAPEPTTAKPPLWRRVSSHAAFPVGMLLALSCPAMVADQTGALGLLAVAALGTQIVWMRAHRSPPEPPRTRASLWLAFVVVSSAWVATLAGFPALRSGGIAMLALLALALWVTMASTQPENRFGLRFWMSLSAAKAIVEILMGESESRVGFLLLLVALSLIVGVSCWLDPDPEPPVFEGPPPPPPPPKAPDTYSAPATWYGRRYGPGKERTPD